MSENDKENFKFFGVMLLFMGALCIGVAIVSFAIKMFNIYTADLSGKSDLKSAAWESRVKLEKARGIAEANKIINDSMKNNESYLRYLWIESLQHTRNKVIYVPTESGFPVTKNGQLIKEKDERRKDG